MGERLFMGPDFQGYKERVLQYRQPLPKLAGTEMNGVPIDTRWTDWTDVPVVTEHNK